MDLFHLSLYITFGILPSLIWLFYYLKKDLHPEPKRMIVKVFFAGMIVTVPVFICQLALAWILDDLRGIPFFANFPFLLNLFKWFIVIAFTEELFKYVAVRLTALKSKEIDEPLDIMLYMVVAALGFAALENMFYLFSPLDATFEAALQSTISISFIRFIGATLLHALCSALVGYFIVISYLRSEKRLSYTLMGITLATLLHGLYDFSIITLSTPLNFIVPLTIVLGLFTFVVVDFDEVKKVKSICKL